MTGPKFGLAPAQQNMDHAPDKKNRTKNKDKGPVIGAVNHFVSAC